MARRLLAAVGLVAALNAAPATVEAAPISCGARTVDNGTKPDYGYGYCLNWSGGGSAQTRVLCRNASNTSRAWHNGNIVHGGGVSYAYCNQTRPYAVSTYVAAW